MLAISENARHAALLRASESAFLITEELALEQIHASRCSSQPRTDAPPRRRAVDSSREHLLARAVLTRYQDRRIRLAIRTATSFARRMISLSPTISSNVYFAL